MIRVIFGTHLKLEKHTTRRSKNRSSAGELANPFSKGGQGRGGGSPDNRGQEGYGKWERKSRELEVLEG